MTPAVHAVLADGTVWRELEAGFEEEGVPLALEAGAGGEALASARAAARSSPLGIGIGGDARALVVVLAAAPARAYLQGALAEARALGAAAARLAARRPLGGTVTAGGLAPGHGRSSLGASGSAR